MSRRQASNNIYGRGALEEKRIRITTSTSTEDALEQLDAHDFDVIISDMKRPEGDRAGYDLLERSRRWVIGLRSSSTPDRAEKNTSGKLGGAERSERQIDPKNCSTLSAVDPKVIDI